MSVQSMEALLLANEVRTRRAELKRDISAGRVSMADVLLGSSPLAMTMPLCDLLRAQRGWGELKVRRAMSVCGVPESKRLIDATSRQRSELVKRVLA